MQKGINKIKEAAAQNKDVGNSVKILSGSHDVLELPLIMQGIFYF